MSAREVAEQLLDAQVEFLISEISGDRLAEVVDRDVRAVLEVAGTMRVADVIDIARIKETVHRGIADTGDSELIRAMTPAISDTVYNLEASDRYTLGDAVDREPVSALIAHLLSMHNLQERVLDELMESPLVGEISSRFVNKIVGDFVAENRAKAEKLPGVGGLMRFGAGAASRVMSAADQALGDVGAKANDMALKRVNGALKDILRNGPIHEAAMQVFDMKAKDLMSGTRDYLTETELRTTVLRVYDVVQSVRQTEYFTELIEACVDTLFAKYGDHTLAQLLPELGIDPEDLIADLTDIAPAIIEAAKANGVLAAKLRERLALFFLSDGVLAILDRQA